MLQRYICGRIPRSGHIMAVMLVMCIILKTLHVQAKSQSTHPSYCSLETVYSPNNEHCYGFLGRKVTWAEAEMACATMGASGSGHVITINNYQEALFLSAFPSDKLRSRHTWINYHNIGGNGNWSRRDCSPQAYVPHGSRNHFCGHRGQCGMSDLLANVWTASQCDKTRDVLCEFESGPQKKDVPTKPRSCLQTTSGLNATSSVSGLFTTFIDMIRPHSVTSSGYSTVQFMHTYPLTNKNNKSKSQYRTETLNMNVNSWLRSKRDMRSRHLKDNVEETISKNISKNRTSVIPYATFNELELNRTSYSINSTDSLQLVDDNTKYKNKTTTGSPKAEPAHVVIGIMGIVVFVILIGGLFINDLRSVVVHVIRGGETRMKRDKQAVCCYVQQSVPLTDVGTECRGRDPTSCNGLNGQTPI